MKKRILSAAVAVILTAAMFTGCASSGGSSTTTSGDSSKPTTLQMWYHISPDQAKVLLTFLDEYQSANPNIKIETQSVPFQEMKKQLSIGTAAGQLPDLALCDTVDNVSFAAMGVADDITTEVNAWGDIDNFYPGPKSSGMYNDKYYGLPFYSNCLSIMYNKDIFDKMKVPYPTSDWTWSDFIDKVHKTNSPDAFGLTMCLFKSEEGTFDELPFFWQAGADWNTLNTPQAVDGLKTINDLYTGHYMSKELISMTQADMCSSLFSTGKSAMMVAGSWLSKNIKNANPNLNYAAVPLPMVDGKNTASPIGGGNLMMLTKDKKAQTWDLMKWLNSKDNQQKYCEQAGYIPPRKDAADAGEIWKTDPILSVYQKSMANARARGPHPQWPQISSAIQFAVQDTLSGAKTPEQALKSASDEIAAIKK